MTTVDEPTSATTKRPKRLRSLVFRVFIGGFLGAILLAWLVPALVARGMAVGAWVPWTVVLGSVALCTGPEIVRRLLDRG